MESHSPTVSYDSILPHGLDDIDTQTLLAAVTERDDAQPYPDQEPETSRFSSDSSDSFGFTTPLIPKSGRISIFQLSSKRISELLHDLSGSVQRKLNFDQKSSRPRSTKGWQRLQELTDTSDEATSSEEDKQSNSSPVKRATSLNRSSSTSSSSSFSTNLWGRSFSLSRKSRVEPPSLLSMFTNKPTVARSSTLEPASAVVKSSVATKGKNDGVWVCCLCKKWSRTSHPICGKVRATGDKKPEYWPCKHEKCNSCAEMTERSRKQYEEGGLGAGMVVGELLRSREKRQGMSSGAGSFGNV
ncbi:uncharacterized protein RSE6_04725 [Rhynchosporium secalis]|uniref:Uncharacterized protein n=1 Tax=Rhynchosporium secalis TaxID=38038 RepID=A0A1E1M609_RHYSE|nr:uncharacterized protein RSE6_04725 [Rhynchosporium secalis]